MCARTFVRARYIQVQVCASGSARTGNVRGARAIVEHEEIKPESTEALHAVELILQSQLVQTANFIICEGFAQFLATAGVTEKLIDLAEYELRIHVSRK